MLRSFGGRTRVVRIIAGGLILMFLCNSLLWDNGSPSRCKGYQQQHIDTGELALYIPITLMRLVLPIAKGETY